MNLRQTLIEAMIYASSGGSLEGLPEIHRQRLLNVNTRALDAILDTLTNHVDEWEAAYWIGQGLGISERLQEVGEIPYEDAPVSVIAGRLVAALRLDNNES